MNTPIAKGIDVSRWQGNIDWPKVKSAGIAFAMIKLGSGDYTRKGILSLDPNFRINLEQALAAGLDVGVYFYSYALSVSEARKEAAFVAEVLEDYRGKLTYPVAFDLEDPTQANLGKAVLSGMVNAFGEILEAKGWYVSLYANCDWLTNKIDADTVKRFDVWLAQWAATPTYSGAYGMWQYAVLGKTGTKGKDYTVDGSIAGINANIDVNYVYKDYPAIVREYGLNGFKGSRPQDPEPEPEPEPERDEIRDTLEMLAAAEIIDDADAWAARIGEPITVGEVVKLLGKLCK